MAQLAIKGHKTRAKEVIQLLEMLGGENKYNLWGNAGYYVIECGEILGGEYIFGDEQYTYFTLEEFEKKFPYKIGDKVYNIIHNENQTITEVAWDFQEDVVVYQTNNNEYLFVNYLQPYKEETVGEKEPEPKAPILSNRYDYAEGKCGYVIPDGYEFDYIKEGFQTEIILKPKKPTYPKTYEECCEVLMGKTNFSDFSLVLTKLSTNINEENSVSLEPPYISLINKFYKLLICRDAYWRLYGEEKGLGKSWEPDWREKRYIIYRNQDNIIGGCREAGFVEHHIFEFPIREMRDTFYKNFRELIEDCKELL